MAYNSTSWTTDSLTKATNSTSTDDSLSISGNLSVGGILNSTLTIGVAGTGQDVTFYSDTIGAHMLYDASEDALHIMDDGKLLIGTGSDLKLYHNGSNSFISNATGSLEIARETSGVAVNIGHSTSETTVGDNLTVVGQFACNGQSVAAAPDWTVSNKSGTSRSLDANGNIAAIGDNLAQLVDDLISIGILQ